MQISRPCSPRADVYFLCALVSSLTRACVECCCALCCTSFNGSSSARVRECWVDCLQLRDKPGYLSKVFLLHTFVLWHIRIVFYSFKSGVSNSFLGLGPDWTKSHYVGLECCRIHALVLELIKPTFSTQRCFHNYYWYKSNKAFGLLTHVKLENSENEH